MDGRRTPAGVRGNAGIDDRRDPAGSWGNVAIAGRRKGVSDPRRLPPSTTAMKLGELQGDQMGFSLLMNVLDEVRGSRPSWSSFCRKRLEPHTTSGWSIVAKLGRFLCFSFILPTIVRPARLLTSAAEALALKSASLLKGCINQSRPGLGM
jgi:hypothetical protein